MSLGERKQRRFTESELKKFDGRDGKLTYVAFKGKVYDVSGSLLWVDGKHMGSHTAGVELTRNIVNAPHGDEVFSRFPVIGELKPAEPVRESIGQILRRLAPHPMLVHFPIAYAMLIPLFSVLYVLTGEVSLEIASYYVRVLGFLVAPICALSGFVSLKVAYGGKRTRPFMRKIIFSIILVVVVTISFIWRTLDSRILLAETSLSYVYLALLLSLIPIIFILGHTGGKIVFP